MGDNKSLFIKGEILEIEIDSIGRKGDGVGRHKDVVVIVPNTEMGKTYKVKITSIYDNFVFGVKEQEV